MATTTRKPTPSQAALLDYFATGRPNNVRTPRTTYDVCVREGWLEPVDAFPFHRITDAGRAALAAA